MNKRDLESLNAELIDLLMNLREQIDEKLDELAAVQEDLETDSDDEETGVDDDDLAADHEDAEE